jgi:DNA-binding transcriptional ArsR family regulator
MSEEVLSSPYEEGETVSSLGDLRPMLELMPLFAEQWERAGRSFVSGVLDALGHPTRLAIVLHLRKRPMSVSELVEVLKVSQANVSQHLGVLVRAGILVREARGSARRYSLRGEEVARILDMAYEFWLKYREDIFAERSGE